MKLVPHNHLWNFQHNNWGPKFGFAYTPAFSTTRWWCAAAMRWPTTTSTSALFNNALEDGPGIANFGLCCGGTGNTAGISIQAGHQQLSGELSGESGAGGDAQRKWLPTDAGVIEVYGAPRDSSILRAISSRWKYSTSWRRMTATIGYAGHGPSLRTAGGSELPLQPGQHAGLRSVLCDDRLSGELPRA